MKPLWIYVVKFPRPIQKIIQWFCGLRGHRVGDTGYSGCGVLHCYCKNCNHYFTIPLSEMPSKNYLRDIFNEGEK
jgi:hypothetical protein